VLLFASFGTLLFGVARYYQVKWALEEVDVMKGLNRLGLRYYIVICGVAFLGVLALRWYYAITDYEGKT